MFLRQMDKRVPRRLDWQANTISHCCHNGRKIFVHLLKLQSVHGFQLHSWHITYTHNHQYNEETVKLYIENVIVSYTEK